MESALVPAPFFLGTRQERIERMAEMVAEGKMRQVCSTPKIEGGVPEYRSALGVGTVLFLVATAVTMAQYKVPTIMTDFMAQFAIDATTASWSMSIFTFVGIVVALPTGFLARRFGPKNLIVAAVVLNVCAGITGAFASDFLFLLAVRALEGVALVFVVACAPLVIQACVDPAKMGTATGIYMLGGMLGATFAGLLTPTLYCSMGHVGLWVGYALITAVAGATFAWYVNAPKAIVDASAGITGGWRVFFKPNTWLFLAPFAIFQMVLLTILAFAPTALQQQGMSPAQSGIVSTLPMMLAVISSVAFGAISDRLGRCKPLCILGMLVLGPCCFAMLNVSGPLMWAALVIMGLLAMGAPTVFVAAYPSVLGRPELMSMGMGVLLFVQSLGQFLGTVVPAMLLGPSLDQWMLCGLVAAGAALLGTVCVALCKFK